GESAVARMELAESGRIFPDSASSIRATLAFSNTGEAGISGTMADNGAVTLTPNTADQAIVAGYHNGSGKVVGDAGLTAANIKSGVTIFGVMGSFSGSSTATVHKTGLTTCYDPATNAVVSCAGTGQDGAYATTTGASVPTRFNNNGDGTVTDNLTGLIWLADANGLADGTCSLSDGSSAGGWRLPNTRELYSLIDVSNINPALPAGHPFSGVQAAFHWTSTTNAGGSSVAWYVGFHVGRVGYGNKAANSFYVWPVRGGQ
ncbi:MAG: DUF1566 domain-containing protein, partial [Gammaproteobacteria bacterium]|nr:DUF1566 domain-containing protein [Gammaproteobacteria bacterium]